MMYLHHVTWSQLTRLQSAFSQKALLMLPLVAIAVSAVPIEFFRAQVIGKWQMHFVFWGALLLLIGQVLIRCFRPVEFERELDIRAEMGDILSMSTRDSFKSSVSMLEDLCKRYAKNKPPGLDDGQLLIAHTRIAQALDAGAEKWQEHVAPIMVSQRKLREYDAPRAKLVSLLFVSSGVLLMLFPTLSNVLVAAFLLIESYLPC